MACLFALIALISPRLALFLVWLLTPLVNRAFDGFLIPFLGFLFLPMTTLLYVLVYSPDYGVSGFGYLLVLVGFLIDLGSYGGSGYRNRDRFRRRDYY
ncbi:MAG: hypothetical protein J0I20_06435 [Chloroflexi bacterium]|nr:hypothetical protein [Chloroflexota bacterium]OJV90224.1 MAG: hypothetical protein BGO39_02375 [Chloroflexi bacterium 54-19]